MGGIVLAFKDYYPKLGIYDSPWIDPLFKHFIKLFEDAYFWTVLKNTVVLSLLRLGVGFFFPIFLALLFNELKFKFQLFFLPPGSPSRRGKRIKRRPRGMVPQGLSERQRWMRRRTASASRPCRWCTRIR